MSDSSAYAEEGIAIIGMSCRFPGARNPRALWDNLCAGVEGIRRFTDEELLAAGISARDLADPDYVKARGFLDDTSLFDAGFFDIVPREATLMDPQHRFFLECAWEALEDAGCDPARAPGPIGVFAGASISTYLLGQQVDMSDGGALLQLAIGNFSDYLASRVAYKLNLKGPAVGIQTACSTSLVAVHMASLNLLAGQCDVALAGGVSIRAREVAGYRYREGGIFSPDGHCRPFDAKGAGTVEGSGVGLVVLKRLEDALEDGDHIRAVIRGTAINNDGAMKIGFTAPSVQGQAAVIEMAQAAAQLEPEDIGYIEAHGTATALGDPIEIAALRRAFDQQSDSDATCAIGSIKSNIGHLDSAAGVAGLIKTVLALEARQLPPSLHFERPNPQTQLDDGRFFVNATLRPWDDGGKPRRAGVSSFGIGGTNAHVVVEEAPPLPPTLSLGAESCRVVPLSAKSPAALLTMAANLRQHLQTHPDLDIAEVSYSLQTGRSTFPHRMAAVGSTTAQIADALVHAQSPREAPALLTTPGPVGEQPALMMFTGQGAQYADMARGLYRSVAVFREHLDHCCDILRPQLDLDLRTVLFPRAGQADTSGQLLAQTRITQPALFAIEYALARMWMSWGVVPEAMIGHSVGEYVAACLAEVFTLEDALSAVSMRGALMQRQRPGAMLSVPVGRDELEPLLGPELCLAAVNGPALSVLSGPAFAIEDAAQKLRRRGVKTRRLHTSHGFHSAMMQPAAKAFANVVGGLSLRTPKRRFVSNVTGTWITDKEATSSGYWADQMLQPVLFAPGLHTLLGEDGVLIEVGPGTTLMSLAKRHPAARGRVIVASLRHPKDAHADASNRDGDPQGDSAGNADWRVLMRAVARLWLAGVDVDWRQLYGDQVPRRVPLPTYPFERKSYWLQSAPSSSASLMAHAAAPVAPAPHQAHNGAENHEEANINGESPTVGTPAASRALTTADRVGAIWSSFLGFADIGIHDSFFELGGDSLLATQVISRLRDEFQISLALKELFAEPTIAGIAARIELARKTGNDTDAAGSATVTDREPVAAPTQGNSAGNSADNGVVALVPANLTGDIPLSFAQERMWILEHVGPPSSAYHLAQALRLHGPVNVEALERAFAAVLHRHHALRTSFEVKDGRPFQKVHPEVDFVLRRAELPTVHTDSGETANAEWERAIEDRMAAEVATPFDLQRAPLIRALLLCHGQDVYTVVITMHHIIADGWSLKILVQELVNFYDAIAGEGSSDITPLPIQYPDFAHWQRQVAQGDHYAQSLAYWQTHLAGISPLNLPLDRPRPPMQTHTGATHAVALGMPLSRDLEELCRQQQVTPFMALLTAFAVVLHRYSGQNDFAIGVPVAGRTHSALEPLIGLFVNTLALRFAVPDAATSTVRDLLQQMRETALNGFAHQQVPFEQVVDAVQPVRDHSRTPLFQTMFSLQEQPVETLRVGEGKINGHFLPVDTGAAQFDLTLWMHRTPRGFEGGFEYRTELFEPETIAQLSQHFCRVVETLVEMPAQRASAVPLLSPEQRDRIVAWGQGPRVAAAPQSLVHQRFSARSRKHPDALAIRQGTVELSYGALEARANRLAHYLASRDIGPGSRVTLEMDLSIDAVVAILAVLKCGAAYVPVASTTPKQRVALIRQQSGAALAITAAADRGRVEPHGGTEEVSLLSLASQLREFPVHCPLLDHPAQRPAYVVYTSGTTGIPKGVVVPHSALATHCESITEAYGLTARDRILGRSSLSFDVAAEEIFPTLAAGATLILQPVAAMDSMRDFVEFLEREALTVVNLPSSLWHEWVDALPQLQAVSLPHMRLLIVGNQEPSLVSLRRWRTEAPYDCRLLNAYGTSETTITSVLYELTDAEDAPEHTRVPIGRPIANARTYVVDTELEPVPVGVEGELCIGGTVLALGYLDKSSETARSFVPDPFARRPGARLYRTGDRARYRRDGAIEFLGRRDDQIKIRGYRIEIGEIENNLRDLAEVRDAAVIYVERKDAEAWLGACIALSSDASVTVSDVQTRLSEQLPPYMVPARWLVLYQLPRDVNGKLQRQRLADMLASQGDLGARGRRQPQSATEKRLAAIWADVLSRSEVGVDDGFFELGGDSLLALRVVARAQAHGIDLSARALFEHQTIARLCAATNVGAVGAVGDGAGGVSADSIGAGEVYADGDTSVPLAPMQARFFARGSDNPHHDSRSLLLQLPEEQGHIDPSILQQALYDLWRRHDALRLGFAQDPQGNWQATIASPMDVPAAVVSTVDLSHLDTAAQKAAIGKHIIRLQQSLDLSQAPALRLAWFDLGADVPGRLLIIAHVLIVDAVAWAVLLDELQASYDRIARRQRLPLPRPASSYRRWLAALTEQAQAPDVRARAAEHAAALRQPCPSLPLGLPQDLASGENREATKRVVHSRLDLDTSRRLLQAMNDVNTAAIDDEGPGDIGDSDSGASDKSAFLLALLAPTLCNWSGGAVLVDVGHHGRDHVVSGNDRGTAVAVEGTIGGFSSDLPIRMSVDADSDDVGPILTRVRRQLSSARGHDAVRFLGTVQDRERLQSLPQPQISFDFMSQRMLRRTERFALAPEDRGAYRDPDAVRTHILQIVGSLVDGALQLEWRYSEAVHDRDTIEALARDYEKRLQAAAAGIVGTTARHR